MTLEELLKPGQKAQNRYTGEVFEVRKVRPTGEVVIKIARGDHFNTYTVKKESIAEVGSPLEAKPLGGGGRKAASASPKVAAAAPPQRFVKKFVPEANRKDQVSYVFKLQYRVAGHEQELPVWRPSVEVWVDPKSGRLASEYDPDQFAAPGVGGPYGPVENHEEAEQLAAIVAYAKMDRRMQVDDSVRADWKLVGIQEVA